jgi:hypothetical protein
VTGMVTRKPSRSFEVIYCPLCMVTPGRVTPEAKAYRQGILTQRKAGRESHRVTEPCKGRVVTSREEFSVTFYPGPIQYFGKRRCLCEAGPRHPSDAGKIQPRNLPIIANAFNLALKVVNGGFRRFQRPLLFSDAIL